MRQSVKEFVQIAAAAVPMPEPIYEFGSLQVPGQEGFADLRPLFPGRTFVGSDVREGPGVDRLLDLHRLDLPDGSVGTALLLDTLEHVEYFWLAMAEVYRVLCPGGVVVISSVMDFPIHDYPHDYWRFTPDGFKSLLQRFPTVFAGYAGPDESPHTVVGIGVKSPDATLEPLAAPYADWQRRWYWPWRPRWRNWLPLIAPSGLILLYHRLARPRRPGVGR